MNSPRREHSGTQAPKILLFKTSSLIFSQIVIPVAGLAVVKSGNEIEIVVISSQLSVQESVQESVPFQLSVHESVPELFSVVVLTGASDGLAEVPELFGVDTVTEESVPELFSVVSVTGASDGIPEVPELFSVDIVIGASDGTVGVLSLTVVVVIVVGVDSVAPALPKFGLHH